MKATVQKLEKNIVMLEVEVDTPKVDKALDQAYRRIIKQVNIPGFRKGKAPRFVLEQYIGKETLYSEAAEIIIPPAYEEAITKHKLEPIAQPELELVNIKKGEPLVFKAKVEVKPEVQLGDYLGLELERREVEVTEEDIDKYLKNLQERYAELRVVEDEPAILGDNIIIDFKGQIDGKPYPGMERKDYQLVMGSGTFIPGFEEQLVGARVNEERAVKVTFPNDYHVAELAGKEAIFDVTVKSIKRKELIPIDDEFAKDVSECETLEELRRDIRRRLEEQRKNEADNALRQLAVEKAVEKASVEIPEVMIEKRIDAKIRELEQNLKMQGMELDQLLSNTGKTMDDLRRDLRPQAEKSIKIELVLEAIVKDQNIEATEEDINTEIEKIAGMLKQAPEEVRKNLGDLSFLKYDIMNRKAIDLLVEKSVIVTSDKVEETTNNTVNET